MKLVKRKYTSNSFEYPPRFLCLKCSAIQFSTKKGLSASSIRLIYFYVNERKNRHLMLHLEREGRGEWRLLLVFSEFDESQKGTTSKRRRWVGYLVLLGSWDFPGPSYRTTLSTTRNTNRTSGRTSRSPDYRVLPDFTGFLSVAGYFNGFYWFNRLLKLSVSNWVLPSSTRVHRALGCWSALARCSESLIPSYLSSFLDQFTRPIEQHGENRIGSTVTRWIIIGPSSDPARTIWWPIDNRVGISFLLRTEPATAPHGHYGPVDGMRRTAIVPLLPGVAH